MGRVNGSTVVGRCERCSAAVQHQGLCPACLLRDGLESSLAPDALVPPEASARLAAGRNSRCHCLEDAASVDSYDLHAEIGRGGMGVVYLAEQTRPIRRRVALKLIKPGMDTEQVIARFEAERQALALMDHPNVARVLGAGASDAGRPYFVMELVRGSRITDYCDKSHLSTRERLELFLQVCRAIQHAHQKGIIHRDIKPSNILVTQQDGAAMPKVIDFGIAKATSGLALTDKTVFTGLEQFLGTPAYTSPEQAAGEGDIDTRSDIYSLGVLLYELLTGKTPFDSHQLIRAGWEEMRRTIRETEPQRPSTCLTALAPEELSRVARRRRAEPPKLINAVRGDLDWIVMKCLEKERERRYDTCSDLAYDVERHLHHEPVAARPPGNLYRLHKLVRRHAVGLSVASTIVVTLLAGLGATTWALIKHKEAQKILGIFRRTQVDRTSLPTNRFAVLPATGTEGISRAPSTAGFQFLPAAVSGATPPGSPTRRSSASPAAGTKQPRLIPPPAEHDATQPLASAVGPPSSLNRGPSPLLTLRESDARAETVPASADGLAAGAGATYPQLAASWWAWLMTLPLTNSAGAIHPLFDTPFFDVAEGQRPEVWFLSTPFGNVTRSCIIPPGTWIFLALLNAECSSLEDPESGFHGNTAAGQGACARFWADHIVNLFCEIDGVPVPDLGAYRVLSPQITFTAPTPWIYGATGGTGTSVGDGYFVLISPFNPGQHTLRCGGGFLFRRPVDPFEDYYPVEMTYFLTVPEAPL